MHLSLLALKGLPIVTHKHYLAFGVGVAVGYFALPMLINLIRSRSN